MMHPTRLRIGTQRFYDANRWRASLIGSAMHTYRCVPDLGNASDRSTTSALCMIPTLQPSSSTQRRQWYLLLVR